MNFINYSILQNFSKKNLFDKPFPYILIRNALAEDLYNELKRTAPLDKIKNNDLNNFRGNFYAEDLIGNNKYNTWIEFLKYHQSREFLNEILDVFSQNIKTIYPGIIDKIKELKVNNYNDNDERLTMGASYAYTTKVAKKSSSRKVHIDRVNKLCSALFYMRDKDDNSEGGDLYLYKWKNDYDLKKKKTVIFSEDTEYNVHHTEELKRVGYEENTMVLMLNTIDSLHGVTERSPTKHIRQFFYTATTLPFDLIDVELSLLEKIQIDKFSFKQKIKFLFFGIVKMTIKFIFGKRFLRIFKNLLTKKNVNPD